MSTLTVWKFNNANGAENALDKLQDLQKQELIKIKPCPSPEVEFCLRENYSFRAGLGIADFIITSGIAA